jgi:hypothetical protein
MCVQRLILFLFWSVLSVLSVSVWGEKKGGGTAGSGVI